MSCMFYQEYTRCHWFVDPHCRRHHSRHNRPYHCLHRPHNHCQRRFRCHSRRNLDLYHFSRRYLSLLPGHFLRQFPTVQHHFSTECMNHFCWKCHFLSCVKKKFSEEFHKEARRQYTVHQEAERLKAKIQQLDNANNPSTAGYLLRENHTLKPHDNTVIKINLNRIEEAENLCNKLRKKLR